MMVKFAGQDIHEDEGQLVISIGTGKQCWGRQGRANWGQSWKVCVWVEGVSVDSVTVLC